MHFRSIGLALVGLVATALLASSGQAQTLVGDPFDDALLPFEDAHRGEPTPDLTFRLLIEIPLPGPLPEGGPRLEEARIRLPVAAGVASLSVEPGAELRIDTGPAGDGEPAAVAWVESDDGRQRYRVLEQGAVAAERRCERCPSGWKTRWRLRVAGNTLTAPLLDAGRLFFGATDNRVYCVKRKNGHRVWSADVSGRVSRPLVHWSGDVVTLGDGTGAAHLRLDAVLVVPDDGSRLLALSPDDGSKLAGIDFGNGEGRLVGPPLALADGRIAVARQQYAESEASLAIYSLVPPPPVAVTDAKANP